MDIEILEPALTASVYSQEEMFTHTEHTCSIFLARLFILTIRCCAQLFSFLSVATVFYRSE